MDLRPQRSRDRRACLIFHWKHLLGSLQEEICEAERETRKNFKEHASSSLRNPADGVTSLKEENDTIDFQTSGKLDKDTLDSNA